MSTKLKSLERSLGLAPKQYPPMSDKMQRIARQHDRAQAPAPAPDHGLGEAIEAAVDQAVQQRVEEALEQRQQLIRQPPAPVTDYRQLPPVPRTPAPKKPLNMLIHRDGAGLISWCEMDDGTKVELIRDRAGKTVALQEITESPVLAALDIPYKAEARQYRAPGKIYGNHLVDQDES